MGATSERRQTRIIDNENTTEFENNINELTCTQCQNGSYEIIDKNDLFETLVKMAEKAEAKIEIISTDTEEGEMLSKAFGGIAAILSYRQSY